MRPPPSSASAGCGGGAAGPSSRTARLIAIACLAVCLAAGCGHGSARRAAAPRLPFAYDRSAPLRYRDAGVVNRGYPIAVHDVSYASPKGGRVPAYLVVPPGRGRRPAVVYAHGSGGDRTQLLVPATWMAARGAVALTISAREARGPRPAVRRGEPALEQVRSIFVQNVVDVRRAVDVLRSLPDVDPHRIAFVGWSAGARLGAVVAGVDHRIRAFDLVSGGATPIAEYVRLAPQGLRARIREVLTELDPLRWVRRAAPSALFFQDGRHDEVVSHGALVRLARAGSEPKRVRWYDAGHAPSARAYRDQLAWLSGRLGLGGAVVRGVPSGP
jgi:dienelactone hydrolase